MKFLFLVAASVAVSAASSSDHFTFMEMLACKNKRRQLERRMAAVGEEEGGIECDTVDFDEDGDDIPVGRNLQRSRMWESGVVPYVVSDVFDKDQRCAIANAMADIMGAAGPCVKFVPREEHHTEFITIDGKESGCHFSKWKNLVNLNITDNCLKHGTPTHELLHSLGFHHEQTRPDRDNCIKINWENIGRSYQWIRAMSKEEAGSCRPKSSCKICKGLTSYNSYDHCTRDAVYDTMGLTYDYNSIMHYYKGDRIEAVDGPNCSAYDGNVGMGNKKMSQLDIKKLKKAYKCK